MRLAGLALSAAMISGCSFVGGQGNPLAGLFKSPSQGHYNAQSASTRCHIQHPQAPIPAGCHPSEVRVVGSQASSFGQPSAVSNQYAGGFPQQPQFGQPQYTTGEYGSHASGNVHTDMHQGQTKPTTRRPKFRGTLDLGFEQSVSGDLIDYSKVAISPITGYNPNDYNEATVSGSVVDGSITRTRWYADSRLSTNPNSYDEISMPSISFDDAWLSPATIGAGGEFILSDKATLFARAGYTRAEGTSGGAASMEGTIFQETTVETYESNVLVGTTVATEFDVGNTITDYAYDFTDMERIDLEAGGRFYLNPIAGQNTGRTVTPFIGASAGASRYNDVSFTIDQRQLSYSSVYQDDVPEYYDLDVAGYDLDNDPATPVTRTVDLYDSQWVPSGSLKAGVEWQVTSKTALAFETGLRVEGARDYSNGNKGDTNITVPLTLRGSFNF
jgi:hypothetical protein